MNRLSDYLRAARKFEWLILIALICVLLVLWMNGESENKTYDAEETRMQRILSTVDGAGKVDVMLSRNENTEITGALITYNGTGGFRMILELQRAVRALTGLEIDRIEVIKSKR